MASKNDKTSKTARVMNLLSKKTDPAAEEGADPRPAAPASPTPPIVTSMAPDAAVSAQIKSALEDVLEFETATPAAPEPEPVQAAPAPEPQPVQAAPAPEPEPVQEPPAPEPQPVQEPPAPEAADDSKWSHISFPAYPGYINVMQVLVEEKAPKYIQMFGLCACARCLEDVKALTLNHLPPKYVVAEKADMVPRLTVYESKFSSDITSQLLQACKLVMERPHHGR